MILFGDLVPYPLTGSGRLMINQGIHFPAGLCDDESHQLSDKACSEQETDQGELLVPEVVFDDVRRRPEPEGKKSFFVRDLS